MASETLPSTAEYYMGIALAVREKANCVGNRVGSVLVHQNRIVSTGYNGTPEGMPNCLDGGCLRCSRRGEFPSGTAYDLCICVHAEQNALLSAARFGISVAGSTLYTTMQPCFGCFKELLQAKIEEVVFLHSWIPLEHAREAYEGIQKFFPRGVRQVVMSDPRTEWAVSLKRKESGQSDETEHE